MAGKCPVIISSGLENKEKAIVGFRYSLNVKRNSLLDDIKVILFAPSEKALESGDMDFPKLTRDLMSLNVIPIACRGVARAQDIMGSLESQRLQDRWRRTGNLELHQGRVRSDNLLA